MDLCIYIIFCTVFLFPDLVGMTWLLASYDAYSVQRQTDSGSLENCASLVKNGGYFHLNIAQSNG